MKESISEILLLTVGILSAFIAYAFYTSKNGRLRLLMIELFSAKVFLYTGAAIYYLTLPPIEFVYVRIILVAPMFVVMLKLYKFIRLKK